MNQWQGGGGHGHGQGYGGYGPPPPQQQYPQYHQPPPPTVYVQTQVVKAPFNHTPHVVLTLFTCGGWLPIWLIIWACH